MGKGTVGPGTEYSNAKEWIEASPNHVYIGRMQRIGLPGKKVYMFKQSPFANKTSVFQAGTQAKAVECFRKEYMKNEALRTKARNELDGKILGCWCKEEVCHGDVIVEDLRAYKENEKVNEIQSRTP